MMDVSDDFGAEIISLDTINFTLKKALLRNDFVVKTYNIQKAGDGLLGFLGDHFKIIITYILDGRECNTQMFLKTLPRKNAKRAEFNKEFGLFEKELFIYNEIFSQFENGGAWHPKCYFAQGNDLIFEDLHLKGFKMHELRKPKDRAHTLVSLRTLAKLHSASLLLVDRKSKIHGVKFVLEKKFAKGLGVAYFSDNSFYNSRPRKSLQIVGFSERYGKDTIYYNKIKSQWDQLYVRGRKQLLPSKEYCNVVSHLDLWNNNFLYKYDEFGNPQECVLVDFQAYQVCPPAADVVSFLYLNLDKTFRDDCFDELVRIYYEEVVAILRQKDVDAEQVISWKSFRNSCEDYRLWALIESSIIFPNILMDISDIADTMESTEKFEKLILGDKVVEINENMINDEYYRTINLQCTEEIVERYILNTKS